MALEIERKFLLANDDWKREVIKREHFWDGLIARFREGKVRVRLTESDARLTIKGPRDRLSRLEFEYEIPRADAEHMLRSLSFHAGGRGPRLNGAANLDRRLG
jgi:CYTH domain-containing protein